MGLAPHLVATGLSPQASSLQRLSLQAYTCRFVVDRLAADSAD